MMLMAALVIGIVAAAYGFTIIEKKRGADGKLSYPLWRCNPLAFWAGATAFCLVFVGCAGLPKYVSLVRHGVPVRVSITGLDKDERCRVTYDYKVSDAAYTNSESFCGLKPGDTADGYYDQLAPQSATLYLPARALKDETAAIALISIALGAFIVLWFRVTYIVGGVKKP